MCESIHICNNHKTFKKRTDGHFYDLLHLLTDRQKPDSFDSHFEQHFKSTTSHTDLRKCMAFKVVD